MTSSLVGSEMCIRDRGVAVGCGCSSRESVAVERMWQLGEGVAVERVWPVSYTHLTLPTICSV
eukprot:6357262-Prorocentrum_lima.AAC.1